MLEILGIIALFSALKKKLARKGRGKGLAFLAPVFWIGGEVIGAVLGATLLAMQSEGQPVSTAAVYVGAILGALAGAAASLAVIYLVPPILHACPECGEEFTLNLEKTSRRHTCRRCKTTLRVEDNAVVIVPDMKKRAVSGPFGA